MRAAAEARPSQLSGAGGAAAAAAAAAAGPPASRGRGAGEKTKYVIPVGARVRVGDNSRSPVLRGLSGVVISFDGRHVEVKFARAHVTEERQGPAPPRRHATPRRHALRLAPPCAPAAPADAVRLPDSQEGQEQHRKLNPNDLVILP